MMNEIINELLEEIYRRDKLDKEVGIEDGADNIENNNRD